MPELQTDELVDKVSATLEAATQAEPEPQPSSQVEEPTVQDSVPDKERDTLMVQLEEKEAELEQSKNSYRELQGMHDRHYNEHATELAVIKGQMELLKSQSARGVSPAQASAEQQEFRRKWREDIAGDPTKVIDYTDGIAGDLIAEVDRRVEERLKGYEGKLYDVNPYYSTNKEAIDSLSAKYGITKDAAIKIHTEYNGKKAEVAQPGKVPAPGRTPDTGASPRAKTPPKAVDLSPMDREVLMLTGQSQDINKIAKEVGELMNS